MLRFKLIHVSTRRPLHVYLSTSRDSPFFYIKSKMCDRVLDVCGANCSPGAEVIMYTQNHGQPDNQLWYEHGDGGIRSKLNDYCLDSSGALLHSIWVGCRKLLA